MTKSKESYKSFKFGNFFQTDYVPPFKVGTLYEMFVHLLYKLRVPVKPPNIHYI